MAHRASFSGKRTAGFSVNGLGVFAVLLGLVAVAGCSSDRGSAPATTLSVTGPTVTHLITASPLTASVVRTTATVTRTARTTATVIRSTTILASRSTITLADGTPGPNQLPLGRVVTVPTAVTDAVLGFDSPAKTAVGGPEPGAVLLQWDDIKAQVCNRSADFIMVNWAPWSLIGADGVAYAASNVTYWSFPTPLYPDGNGPVPAGECLTGYVVFAAPAKGISGVQYATTNATDSILRWAIH